MSRSVRRSAAFDRRTTETQIAGRLTIDGGGRYDVRTGIRFFDHMLELFTRHGGFDLTLRATGDLEAIDLRHRREVLRDRLGDLSGRSPGGPREGDEVILSDLKDYAGLDELRLK